MKSFCHVLLLFVLTAGVPRSLRSQSADAKLEQTITNDDNIQASRDAIALAGATGNAEALLRAILNPAWTRKSEAVVALGRIANEKKAKAFVELFQDASLWVRIRGGRTGLIQEDFVASIRNALPPVDGKDFLDADLFNADIRHQLVDRLRITYRLAP